MELSNLQKVLLWLAIMTLAISISMVMGAWYIPILLVIVMAVFLEIPEVARHEVTIEFWYGKKSRLIRHTFTVEDDDFWFTFQNKEAWFDVHYCLEYNTICVYGFNPDNPESKHERLVKQIPIEAEG